MRKSSLLIIAVSFCTHAIAALSPGDFAWQIPVYVDDPAPLQSILLPYEFYQGKARTDFGDVRIFNAASEAQPFMLQSATQTQLRQQKQNLRFYPLRESAHQPSNSMSLNIDVNTGQASMRLQAQEERAISTRAYIIENDVSLLDQGLQLQQLQFDWRMQEENIIGHYRLEGSDDLQNWTLLQVEATLAKLSFMGHRLDKNHINLPAKQSQYLRLSWSAQQAPPQMQSVTGLFGKAETEAVWRWNEVQGLHARAEGGVFEFENSAGLPVEKIAMHFNGGNQFFKGRLYSRNQKNEPWQSRGEWSQYHLQFESQTLTSEARMLSLRHDRYWQLRLVQPEAPSLESLPQLRFGWRPQRLWFLAPRPGEYTLAFGNVTITRNDDHADFQRIREDLDTPMVEARLGIPHQPQNAAQKYRQPLPWQEILLWLMLVTGVLLMAWMAYRLYRQMRTPD